MADRSIYVTDANDTLYLARPVVLRWRFVPTADIPNPKWFYTDNLGWKSSRPAGVVEAQILFHFDGPPT